MRPTARGRSPCGCRGGDYASSFFGCFADGVGESRPGAPETGKCTLTVTGQVSAPGEFWPNDDRSHLRIECAKYQSKKPHDEPGEGCVDGGRSQGGCSQIPAGGPRAGPLDRHPRLHRGHSRARDRSVFPCPGSLCSRASDRVLPSVEAREAAQAVLSDLRTALWPGRRPLLPIRPHETTAAILAKWAIPRSRSSHVEPSHDPHARQRTRVYIRLNRVAAIRLSDKKPSDVGRWPGPCHRNPSA